ncbi:hydroxymethylglutaryl-CoA lyase [Stutzerimonas degradans]|uniref:Hydroxymethylglutaryl-CoA lyase n=1 Tax=Stutzerimonas degradans TaxID=2968968 RepID=A0A8E2QCS8_9GAMM|nr:hydroxymethylglutaryl-CoA lyase [Stutzerimonas degradans]MCQ4276014.1 hydroxymethylglutaryl-CoA lyase [Stutzerimonas degradans]PNF76434.1 hydroxymethylglutaryl-CoA lyase [Stutzerimonas degradans]QPT22797.1 hydroxymethylglutaryl-CoA lyase [Stutzerimonas degradans]
MSERIVVNEVGPRDGLQSQGKTLTVEQRLEMIQALLATGIRSIEVGSFVSPKAVPQMAGTDALFARLPMPDQVAYSALIPNAKGYELARAAGARSVAVVLSATETMNQRNIRMSLDETTAVCLELMQQARRDGLEARAYVAVAFECPFEGVTPAERVIALTQRLFDAGADKVIIADTIGAAHPTSVRGVLEPLRSMGLQERLSCHFHDTRGMALANVLASLDAGVREFDSSIGGLGGCPFSPGATGNLATEDLVLMLNAMGLDTGIDSLALVDAVQQGQALTETPLGGHSFRWLQRQHQAHREATHA